MRRPVRTAKRNIHLLFVAMFLLSGTGKLIGRWDFERMLIATGFRRREAQPISQLLPALELGLGLMPLLFRRQRNLFLSVTSLMLSIFSAFLVSAKLNERDIECKCFGVFLARLQGRWAVLRNLGLILLGVISIDSDKKPSRVTGVGLSWRWASLLSSILSYLLGAAAFSRIHKRVPEAETGSIQSNFTLFDSHAHKVDAESFYNQCGDVTTVMYLGSNCQPCNELFQEISQPGLQIVQPLIVIYDQPTPRVGSNREEKLEGKKCDFWDLTGAFAGALSLRGVPALIVLDANKREVLSHRVGLVEVQRWMADNLSG